MKKIVRSNLFKLSFVITLIISISGCSDISYEKITYKANVPKYLSYNDLRSSFTVTGPQELKHPGKIYFKAGYLYVNEMYKGIHIIDNNIQSSPKNIGFINIPGNVDIAIKGSILYADSYIDLLAIDISNVFEAKVVKRIEDVFNYSYPPTYNEHVVTDMDESKGVIVEWEVKMVTEKVEVNRNWFGWGAMEDSQASDPMILSNGGGGSKSAFQPNSVGVAGSMARFMIYEDYLYTIDNRDIRVFNITTKSDPVEGSTINTNRTIETLFIMDNNLFVGSTSGMLIYSLSTPASPNYLSQLNHFTACDPVVVEGDYAYVTLRAGTRCGGWENQLDVIDISTITNPQLLKSYVLEEPYGLGIDNGTLFICDGTAGLKIYDANDPWRIDENMLISYPGINAFDVIPYNNILMMIGSDGIYQYDYQNINNITLLSVIAINP